PAGRARGDLRPRPGRLVGRVAPAGRGEHAAAVLPGGRRRAVHRVRGGAGAAASHPVLRSHRVAIGLYDRTSEGIVRRHRIETDVTGARTVVPELAGQARPDLVLVNDEDLTY